MMETTPTRETRNVEVALYPAVWHVITERAAALGQTAETYLANCIALDVPTGWRDSTLTYPYRAAKRNRH